MVGGGHLEDVGRAGALGRRLADQIEQDPPLRAMFERRTRVAARMLGAPIGVASLADADVFRLVGRCGLDDIARVAREDALAECVVRTGEPLVIQDARAVDGFRDHAAVRKLGWVAYAGIPLHADGVCVGAFSVADRVTRAWSPSDLENLADLAGIIDEGFKVQGALARRTDELALLADSESLYRGTIATLAEGVIIQDARGVIRGCNDAALRILGLTEDQLVGRANADASWRTIRTDGSDYPIHDWPVARTLRTGVALLGEIVGVIHPDGSRRWVSINTQPLGTSPGPPEGAVATFTDVTARRAAELEQQAQLREQRALGSLALLVASDAGPRAVFAEAAEQAASVVGSEMATVVRQMPDGHPVVVGVWPTSGPAVPVPGARVRGAELGAIQRVLRTGSPEIVDHQGGDTPTPGHRSCVIAPISVGGSTWGALAAGFAVPLAHEERNDALARLGRVGELVTLGVTGSEARETLSRLASTDHLTGLPNSRTFGDRLEEQLQHSRRAGRPLALVVIDIDHFKTVNDAYGHAIGNDVLRAFADRLREIRREGEVVARVGGEEFAWLLPGTGAQGARAAAERLREAIGARAFDPVGRLTASFGICEAGDAGDAAELFRNADLALYRSKMDGRDRVSTYRRQDDERAERMSGDAAAIAAIRALATAVDAKDPSTQRHSERVAALAVRLARQAGWAASRSRLLHDAGLVHDVGKIGIPDAILLKPGRLTDAEYRRVQQHASLGAEIVADILAPEQVEWIRHHHERHDGAGYPDGVDGVVSSEGAELLALADAWDAMTVARVYGTPRSVDDALDEIRRLAGSQFAPNAVELLLALHADDGAVPPPEDAPT